MLALKCLGWLFRLIFQSRSSLAAENLALRQQLAVLQRQAKRPRIKPADRWFWSCLCGIWSRWRSALIIVKPETVVRWHRRGFRWYWRRKSVTVR